MSSKVCNPAPAVVVPAAGVKAVAEVEGKAEAEELVAARTEDEEETSYLAHIEASANTNPVDLLREWKVVAKSRGALMPDTMVLSTVNRALEVSSRTVVLRRIDGDSLVFMTDSRSRKAADLEEHPHASVVLAWNYRLGQRVVNRQARCAGAVTKLPTDAFEDLYTREPLYCRVRAHLCQQGATVDWSAHAARHDELLAAHRAGSVSLEQRPSHVVAYSLLPEWFEFYHALDDCIGDRILFRRKSEGSGWTMEHIAA